MKQLFLTIAAVILTVSDLISPLHAASPKYLFQSLGTMTDGGRSEACGINITGQVVGMDYTFTLSQEMTRGFLKSPGEVMQPLGYLYVMDFTHFKRAHSAGYSINDVGQAVGRSWIDQDETFHAFLKNPGETMQDLGTLDGCSHSSAWGINNSGQIVGYAYNTGGKERAFLKNPGGSMTYLGFFGGGLSINESGELVGFYYPDELRKLALLRTPDGKKHDLGTLGGEESVAWANNNASQVVGWAFDSDGKQRAFLKNPGDPMQNLGTLGGVNDKSIAYDINQAGQVVGKSIYEVVIGETVYELSKAFLWDKGILYSLEDLTTGLPSCNVAH